MLRTHAHACVCTWLQWMVEDLSTNGTFINEVKIGKGQVRPLQLGEKLRLSIPAAAGARAFPIECVRGSQRRGGLQGAVLHARQRLLGLQMPCHMGSQCRSSPCMSALGAESTTAPRRRYTLVEREGEVEEEEENDAAAHTSAQKRKQVGSGRAATSWVRPPVCWRGGWGLACVLSASTLAP